MALLGNTAQFLLQMTLVAGPLLEVHVRVSPLIDTLSTVGTPIKHNIMQYIPEYYNAMQYTKHQGSARTGQR